MRMRIHYGEGWSKDALIVSIFNETLRAVVVGTADAIEFRFLLGDWVSEDGDVVRFEFPWRQQMWTSSTAAGHMTASSSN